MKKVKLNYWWGLCNNLFISITIWSIWVCISLNFWSKLKVVTGSSVIEFLDWAESSWAFVIAVKIDEIKGVSVGIADDF